jgi:hypothetical protein
MLNKLNFFLIEFFFKSLLEIAEYKFKNQDEIIEMSKNLFVFKAFTLNDLEKM